MTTPGSQHDAPSPARTIHAHDVLGFLRRGAPLALLVAFLAGAVAFLAARSADPVYRATASVLASEPSAGVSELDLVAAPPIDPGVYRIALLEGPVLADALQRMDGVRPSEAELERFARRMDVQVEDQDISSVIRVEIEHGDPDYAASAANTVIAALIDWDRERARQGVSRRVEAVQRSIDQIDAELQGEAALPDDRRTALLSLRQQRAEDLNVARSSDASAIAVGRLEPLRVASPPERAVGPRVVFDTFVAVVLGLVAAYAFLFARASLDGRIHGRDELRELSDVPVLAEFPRRSRSTRGVAEESAGFLHTNLLLATQHASPLIIALTSPTTVEEKDGIAVGLAESFARGGHRTLLIDGDLRRPGTTEGLDVKTKQSAPFEVHLENPGRRYAPATVAIGGKGTFDFVPSFTSATHPVELLNKGLAEQMAAWREHYDVVIIDSTPVLPFADTLAIARHCTGVVLSTRAGESSRTQVHEALDLLSRSDVSVLGLVLTNVPSTGRVRRPAPARDVAGGGQVDPYRTLPRTADRAATGAAERR